MSYEKLKDEMYNNLGGINTKASEYITGENQFLDIRNFCFERPGAFVSRPGTEASQTLLSSTFAIKPSTLYQYSKSTGESYRIFSSGQTLYSLDPNLSAISNSLYSSSTMSPPFDAVVYNDYMYLANSHTFQRFNGSYAVQFLIPKARSTIVGGFATFNTGVAGPTATIRSGTWLFRYANVKGTGASHTVVGERQATEDVGINLDISVNIGATIVSQGQWQVAGFTIVPGFGISSVAMYMAAPGSSLNYLGSPSLFGFQLTDYGGQTLYNVAFDHYQVGTDWNNVPQFTLTPSYLEVYQNMLFMAGFSGLNSRLFFSDVANQESIPVENFADIRTGNNDVITAMAVFQQNLIVFKRGSIHEVTGSSPDTLSIKDVNLEYGCLNNEAVVQFGNKLWFMDRRGICEYNGPDTFIVSYPVQKYLDDLDKTNAKAFHYKKLSQVWFSVQDTIFVYDYDIKAWAIYNINDIEFGSAGALIKDNTKGLDPVYVVSGSSHYTFARFNPSLFTDLGQGITYSIKTKFHKRLGNSTQELWRRLFVNFNQDSIGLTASIKLYADYATTVGYTAAFGVSAFQTRIDFGVSSKALSAEIIISSSNFVQFNGYTIESRYLRSV